MTPGLSLGRRVTHILSPYKYTHISHGYNDRSPCGVSDQLSQLVSCHVGSYSFLYQQVHRLLGGEAKQWEGHSRPLPLAHGLCAGILGGKAHLRRLFYLCECLRAHCFSSIFKFQTLTKPEKSIVTLVDNLAPFLPHSIMMMHQILSKMLLILMYLLWTSKSKTCHTTPPVLNITPVLSRLQHCRLNKVSHSQGKCSASKLCASTNEVTLTINQPSNLPTQLLMQCAAPVFPPCLLYLCYVPEWVFLPLLFPLIWSYSLQLY